LSLEFSLHIFYAVFWLIDDIFYAVFWLIDDILDDIFLSNWNYVELVAFIWGFSNKICWMFIFTV